jgi:hypothetical protein
MTVTISRMYDDYATATEVVRDLEAAGLSSNDVTIVARKQGATTARHDSDRDGRDDRVEGAETGAAVGAAAGGAAGLLAGLGLLAIPGIGPVVAAGWLTATAAGALTGGAAGGLVGALANAGISDRDAHVYAEGIRRGGSLVSARVPDRERARYEAILNRSAVDLTERRTAYEGEGWTQFDPSIAPYGDDRLPRERPTR